MEKVFCKSNIENHSYNIDPRCCRIGHSAILVGEEIYICGGEGCSQNNNSVLLRFNCSTNTFDSLSPPDFPLRSDHLVFSLANSTYVWGGQSLKQGPFPPGQPYNDLWRISESLAQGFDQSGTIPSPRMEARAVSISPTHLLLYGGFANKAFLNDWYILDNLDFTWRQCQIIGDQLRRPLYKPSLCWSFDRGYLFGGQVLSASQSPQFTNEFYELKFETLQTNQLRLRKIAIEGGPCARSGHCSLVYSKRYVLIIGGQTTPSSNQNAASEFGMSILQDIWVFDTENPYWLKLDLTISLRYGFTANLYRSKIYIFGGAKNYTDLSSELQIIQISDGKCVDSFCGMCRNKLNLFPKPKYRAPLPQLPKPQPHLTIQYVSSMAQMIKSPFSAIGLLVDNSFNMGAHEVRIKLIDSNPTKPYLTIQDDSRPFTHKQFLDAVYKYNIRRDVLLRINKDKEDILLEAEYGSNLKLGGLRLGKSMLFICKNQKQTFVAFISSLAVAIPHTNQFIVYDYAFKKKQPMPINYKFNRQRILKVCQCVINEQMLKSIELDTRVFKKIIVFQLQQINYGLQSIYELSATSENISMRKNLKNLKENDIELSLKSYLSLLYLSPYVGRPIYLQQKQIHTQSYEQILKKLIQTENLKVLKNDRLQQKSSKCLLISVPPSSQNLQQLQGLLLYHDNRLFGVYDYQFGGCFDTTQRFKKAGFVQIPHQIQLNILKSEIQGSVERYILHLELTKTFEDRQPKRKTVEAFNSNPRKILRQN